MDNNPQQWNNYNKRPTVRYYNDGVASVIRKAVVYTELRFYQRSDVLYQLTQFFCQRYLPRYGDRQTTERQATEIEALRKENVRLKEIIEKAGLSG